MAQTIPTPNSDAQIASQPIDPGLFPGLDEAFGLSGEANLDFSDLDKLDISSKLTDSEKGLEDPFAKLPRANPKNIAQNIAEDWRLGQESVNIDMAKADMSRQVLESGQPGDYSAIQKRLKALGKAEYYNQADNIASRALHGTVEILPPMAEGTVQGLVQGGQYGVAGAAGGAAMGSVLGGVGAVPGAALGGQFGFDYGMLKGSFEYWSKQGKGASFGELVDSGVNQVTAARISEYVGPLYAAIEYAQVGKLLDISFGKQLKRGVLRGAMAGIAKLLPEGAKVAVKGIVGSAGQAIENKALKGTVHLATDIAGESMQEANQGVISQFGTEYGKQEQKLIAEGASTGLLDVLATLPIAETTKNLISRGADEFTGSLTSFGVLAGGAKGVNFVRQASWDGFKTLASGDLNKAAAQREAIAKAGAPLTAQAVAEDAVAGRPSATPTAETVTPKAPVVAPVDEPALDAELEAAGKAPEEALQPEAAKPSAGLPGDELGAKIFSSIRSRKPIAKADLDQVGGFSLSTDWKLNEETDNYEYQGKVYEGKEAPKVSAAEAEVAPITKPEAKAPKAQAVAPIESAKPKVLGQVTEAIAPAITPAKPDRETQVAEAWLAGVNQATTEKERKSRIRIISEKANSLSKSERKSVSIFKKMLQPEQLGVTPEAKAVTLKYVDLPNQTRSSNTPLEPNQPIRITGEQVQRYRNIVEKFLNNQPLTGSEIETLIMYAEGKGFYVPFTRNLDSKEAATDVDSSDPSWVLDVETDTWSKKDTTPTNRKLIMYVPDFSKPGDTTATLGGIRFELLPEGITIDPFARYKTTYGALGSEISKTTTPKAKETELPKWEEVQKNKNKMPFLKSVFKKANAKLTKEQQVVPKVGWKKNDFYSALERMYGLITQLEFKQPDEVAPLAPKVAEAPKPTELSESEKRRKFKLQNIFKIFNNSNLDGDQILFRDLAMKNVRQIASQMASQFNNLIDPDGEIYSRSVEAIALRLNTSFLQKTPVFFNKDGKALDITEEAVQTWLRKVADRAGLDAARQQSAKREVFTEFGGKPAEGAITQPSAAKEEDKPTGMQVPIVKSEEVDEPRATVSVREAAAEVRKQSSPEEKLVLDWVVAQLIRENPVADMVINFGKYKGSTLQDIAKTKEGREYLQWLASQELKPGRDGKPFKGDIERNNIIKRLLINSPDPETLRGLRTYLALAEYLSKVAKRTISAKRVGATVDSVVRKLANALTDVGIKVTGEDIMVALSPEGQQAKERFVAEEARAKAARDERTAKANLSDRARNLRSGYAVKQRIIDAIASATLENRARIQNEVIALAEEDLLEDADINNRLDNIEKGLQNEKPAIGQPIPRRGRRGTEQTKEGKVRNRVAEPSENAGGTAGTGATATGQPTDGARRVEPVGARPSGNGQQVGGKQQTATGNVSVDVNLSGSAAKVLAQAAVSNGVPAILQDNPRGASVVAVNFNQVEGQEVPIILVNQKLLAKVRRDIMANYPKDGKAVFAEWAWRAVNQEIIHFRHLKLLERLAKEDGIDYKAYLKKEAKRLIQYIKRKRGLRKKIEAIYNNGEKMGDFELAFEFTRMLVEEKMLGSITESATFDVGKMLASLDSEGRGFIFRFMELVRDLLYGLTGRTEAETRFLRATADAIISEQRKIMRNLYSPNEKLPVGLNFYKPKEKVIVGTAADQKASEEEIRKDTGLNRASMEFLREYARELGIQEPMIKVKKPIKDEKTGKVVERKISFPAWKKPDYVKAIKEKLKELGKKPKELGAAMPMRFKTEYAFQQIDRAVATKKGIFKGLTIANDNTLPWENLKARILNNRFKGKGVSKAEANWVLPTLEALVRNGRVDADQAVAAIKALANSKVEVDYLRSPERPPKEAIQAYLEGTTGNEHFSVKKADLERRLSVRYSEINPKPVREMQNLREILVRAPGVTTFRGHYPGKDVLGFGRMYSTLQGGKNGTFLFEVQSDARDERFSQDNDRDPDSFIFKVSATEKNLLEAFAPEFGNTFTVSTKNYNPYAEEDIVPEGYRDDMAKSDRVLKGDIFSGGVEEPLEIVARKVGENLYHVFGIFAMDLNRLIETNGGGLAEITEDITPVSPPNIQQAIKRKEELEKNKSLLDAYESLVLKAAIADAIANGEDFIAITDAETAAMTEGHREVKQGMRVHYGTANGSLHNVAKKLTGDIGTPFNDGPSSYVYDQEQADQTETPPAVNRYPKKDVTGVSYSLEKLKAQGEDSDVQNILGAAMPTDRPYWLKPDGEILEVDDNPIVDWNSVGGHADAAIEFLRENDPSNTFLVEWGFMDPLKRKERQQSPIQEMINMGWLRVVGDGFNLYFEGDPNKTQLDKLFEAAIEDEVKLIQDQSGLTGRPKSNVWYEPPVEDELGAAMPRLGFSTTEPRFRRAWKELPESLEGLTEFRRITSGTHDVRLYQDSMGDLFVVKRGQTQEQFENEIAAENVYRIMNYPVPRSRLVKDENGNTAKIASWVDGPTLKEFKKLKIGEDKYEDVEEVYRQIGDGMLIDAFLFNYDVLGLDLDNIVVAHDLVPEEDGVTLPEPEVYYTPYRVDNGGTFDTRARGGLKDAFFYDSFQDLTTKYPEIDVTASDVVAQIGDLVLNSDAILNVIPKRLRPMMAQRLQWMADQLSAADIMPPAAGRTEQQVEEHFKRLSTQLAQVEVTRNEQGELINPITGIPSRIYLLDTKGKVIGFTPKSEFRYRLERTPVFKMWFGDWENAPEADGTSKILDQAGEPWVLYHGTSYSKRSDKLRIDEAQQNAEELKRYPRRFSTANLFRGTWTSTSRQFAEDWANDVYGGEYDENVVIPVYVKSTNTFDPRNKEHTKMLVSYLKDKMSFDPYTRKLEVALEFDFYDWTYFEPQTYDIPNTAEERTLKGKYFKRYPYNLLESIVNMGFDGIWVREKALGTPGKLETSPKNLVEELEIIRRTEDKTYEERTTQTLKEDIAAYNENSTWNHLSFRSDGVKSAMNTGKFSTKKQKAFEVFPESARLLNQVTKNNKTGWNEFEKGGKTYASYDKPENLVTYAFSDSASLSRANVAKTTFKKSGVVFFARRTAQDVRSAGGRESTDILGAAMPRRFGVRIKDKMAADAYDKLKNLTYEPIPDSMVQEEAEAYLERHGIRGAMEATISKSSPLEHGSRELLAQIIILKLNEQYNKTKDARILEDLIDYTDTFLSISSEAGRALRQLSFWSKLTPEGMLMLYKKKLDEVNRETRDRFNEFFAKVKRELSTLPAGALDQALKNMEGLLGKADKAAEESRKKLATSNTMTFWENFSKQIGDSLVQKSQEQLNAAEEELARTAGGEATPEGQTAMAKVNNAKTINQAAQEMSRNIKQMFLSLAKEQGKNIRDPRIITDEEFANKTDEEIAKIQQAERDSRQAQKFTDMLAKWPKALQAWQTATAAIRAQTAVNPELAAMFQSFLDLTLETPFTMPQMKRFLSLRGVKLEQLIEEHYQEGKLANNALDLAKKMVEEAGLGAWEEEIGVDVKEGDQSFEYEKREEGMAKAEPSKRVATLSMSQRLVQALALQIEKYAEAETEKKLNRLIESYADKRLEPSLKRFIKRMVQYQALGLFSNTYAWNEFQKQEGLDKLKPEVVKQLLEIMGKAQKLIGFRKEEAYANALSLIAYETNTGLWNFTKSWWYLSILSGLTTQAANLIGNTYNTILLTIPTIGKHIVSGAVNPARSRAIVKQMFRAMSLSLQDLGYVLTTGRIGTRKSDNPFFSQASTDYFEVIARNSPNRASRISATTAAMIRRAMTGVDMMFYNFNKEVYLFDSAYNQAKKSGLKGSEATAKALDLTFRSSGELQNALNLAISEGYVVDGEPLGFFKALSKIESPKTKIERAKQKIEQSIRIQEIIDANVSGNAESSKIAIGAQVYGEELTYNEEPKGFLGAIHKAVSELSVKYGIVSVPIPFTKIVANVWNQGLDAMGLGLFRSGILVHGKLAKAFPPLKMLERFEMKGLKGTADEVQARKDMSFIRSFHAAIAVGILFLLDQAFCGQYEKYGFEFCINGPGPKEPAQKELLKNRLKWKPNSVFFRTAGINGVYLSYMLSSLAIPMAGIGLIKDNEIYNYYAKKSPKDASLAMAHRLLTVPMEMNFLSGLADMFEILSPSNPETALAKTKSFLSRMGSAMLVPNFFRDVDQLLVSSLPGVLNPRTAREDIIQAAFISNTPIIRQMYGSAELDILGQPIEMTSRVLSFAEKDALVDVLIQKNALPTAPKKDKLLGLVPMDDEQYARFREYRAKQLGADLNKPEMIEALSKLEPAMAQLYVQKYTQKANALAKAKLLREDPEILGEAREAKSKQFK